MPENLRALIFVFFLSAIAFALSRNTMTALIGWQRTKVWVTIWVAITTALFLTQNFWLFLLVSSIVLITSRGWERDGVVTYALVLCAAPVVVATIPGFGGIMSFAHIAPQDLFAVLLLFPAWYFQQKTSRGTNQSLWPSIFLVTYFILVVALHLRHASATGTMRAAFGTTLAMLLPFLAFKWVNSTERLKVIVVAFIFPLLPLAFISAFEFVKSWHLYASAVAHWTEYGSPFGYLQRETFLRAYGSTGGPIIFGFIFMTGIGLCLGLSDHLVTTKQRFFLFAILTMGLLPSLSRGPWIGTLVIVVVFLITGRNSIRNLLKFMAAGSVLFIVATMLLGGEILFRLLPFSAGGGDTGSTDYRYQLLQNAFLVIKENPFFGSIDYLQTPEMQEMIQGQGIIDVVNTYLSVALEYGIVGLGVFLLIFISTLSGLARAFSSLPDSDFELKQIGRALFATLCGVLVTIFTVSSVGQIPYIYWILTGLCVAQTNIIRTHIRISNKGAKTRSKFFAHEQNEVYSPNQKHNRPNCCTSNNGTDRG